MNEKLQLRYYNSNTLLVVNALGLLKILHTPFRAMTIEAVGGIPMNTFIYVDKVFHTSEDVLQFFVNGNVYPYTSFRISINF